MMLAAVPKCSGLTEADTPQQAHLYASAVYTKTYPLRSTVTLLHVVWLLAVGAWLVGIPEQKSPCGHILHAGGHAPVATYSLPAWACRSTRWQHCCQACAGRGTRHPSAARRHVSIPPCMHGGLPQLVASARSGIMRPACLVASICWPPTAGLHLLASIRSCTGAALSG